MIELFFHPACHRVRTDGARRGRASLAAVGFLVAGALHPAAVHAANTAAGAEVYVQYCRGCHGLDGRGTSAGAPDFTRGQGLMSGDAVIVRNLRGGGRGMPSYEGLLREQQLLDVVAYLRTLQR